MQLVLIDHGLYISETDDFRRQYCELWKAILTWDNASLKRISSEWGIQFPELLASATLLSPYGGGSKPSKERLSQDTYQLQLAVSEKLRTFLTDTEKLPLELVFLSRNMRIVQATNQFLGSPVNRPSLMANWASAGLTAHETLSWRAWGRACWEHLKFRVTLGVMAVGFWWTRRKQVWFGAEVGWEDLLSRELKSVAKKQFGIELNDEVLLS
jgi:aarF domain-containing kinase